MIIDVSLKALRMRAGLSLKEAAQKLGVWPVTVSNWERGLHRPQPYYIPLLAALYGVHSGDLFNYFRKPTVREGVGDATA